MSRNAPLAGRRGLILGVANKRSIAWGIARALRNAGADLAITFQADRLEKGVVALAAEVEAPIVARCDVADDADVDALVERLTQDWGRLDFLVHSLAFAHAADLEGSFVDTSREGFRLAHDVSAYSLTHVVRATRPLLRAGSSIVTLTYLGAERAIPGYNVMGAAKASLEASVRYLAHDLGPAGIRVNAVSAGPVKTFAATGIAGFSRMMAHARERAPLRRNVSLEEIGAAAAFLVSPFADGVTGEILHVDAGYHVTCPRS